jgi:hypothetical protein
MGLKMVNTTDKMYDRYVYLHIDPANIGTVAIAIQVKMDDEGIVVDAWSREDEVIASTWKTYDEMGVEVRELLTIEKQQKEREDE